MDVRRLDSTDERVSKYVFDFGNAVAEAVLYRYPTYQERTVICLSTQSGCRVGCRHCGSGDAFVRNLTQAEMVAQVEHIFQDRQIVPENIQRCQVMFMSMGEPILNFKEVSGAIRTLYAKYQRFELLLSTMAPAVAYTPLMDLSVEIPTVGLQFSVHESTDEARDALIPFKAKLRLEEIADTGNRWYRLTGRHPFFNYCAHERNTSEADAERLFRLFDPQIWKATVSVVCERDETVAVAHSRQRQLAEGFLEKLIQYGYDARCFDPAGQDDIGGGCGMLWYVQKWMRENPQLTRPSAGLTELLVPQGTSTPGGRANNQSIVRRHPSYVR